MRYTQLPVSSPGLPDRVSVLGFGGAPLMGRVGRKASLAALHAAYSSGINFFDTARSYGYGESESVTGEFLAGRRDSVVLCTKFGILPSHRGGWKLKLKPLAQAAVGVFPQLRQFARRQAAGQLTPGQFTPEVLRTSLEASLRALRTDYVDLLLMHGADASVLSDDALLEALERLVSKGTVRMAGISGPSDTIVATIARRPAVLSTAQFAMDPTHYWLASETVRPEARELFLVGNHPFGGANGVFRLRAQIVGFQSDLSLPASLREKLTGDPSVLMPEVIFGCILDGTGVAAVVAAMTSLPNLQKNVAAVEGCRFTSEELALLRAKLVSAQPVADAS